MKQQLLRLLLAGMLLAPEAAFGQYCVPVYGNCNSQDNNINNFRLAGEAGTSINLVSTGNAVNCYEDYTALSVTLQKGRSYAAAINSEECCKNNVQAFIDFNNDGSFNPATETVGGLNNYASQPKMSSLSLSIPASAPTGAKRMRLVMVQHNVSLKYPNISPCPGTAAGYDIGEVNDFTVNIIAQADRVTARLAGTPMEFTCSISPNPVTSSAVVTLRGMAGYAVLQLVDGTGRLVKNLPAAGEIELDLQDLPVGLYFLKYRDALRSRTMRVIKQ